MPGHGKHIHRLHLGSRIVQRAKESEVAGQRGRIAGDVDETTGADGSNGLEDTRIAAGPRRIDNNDIGTNADRAAK